MDSAGNFVIAWQDGGTTQTAGVYAQRYNSSGVAQGSNTAISTVSGASNPSVAMEPTGQYVIAWQFTQTGTTPGIEAQRFDASGNALTSVVPLSTPENYFQDKPRGRDRQRRRFRRGVGELWPGRDGFVAGHDPRPARQLGGHADRADPVPAVDPDRRQPDVPEDCLQRRRQCHHRLAEQAQFDERQSERLRPAV